MQTILIGTTVIAVLSFFIVGPIMVAASIFKAENPTFTRCFLAVIASVAATQFASLYFDNMWLSALVALVVTAIGISALVDAGLPQSIGIAILSVGLQVAAVWLSFHLFGFVLGVGSS